MKLSIITPSYNQGQFIEKTIKSVVSQKRNFDLEYFIFDGGSTDGSVRIIKKYAKKYPQVIKWQSKKDKGQVDAINQGLARATGDIIAYINSDDYYLSGSLEKVVSFFQKNPQKKWLIGDCKVTKKSLQWTFFLKHLWPIQSSKTCLRIFNTINQPAVFLTKKIVKKVGKFNQKYDYAFDYDYWLRCSKYGLPGRLNSDLAVFRVHPVSKGSTSFKKQFQEDYRVIKKYTKSRLILILHFAILQLTLLVYKLLK